MTQPTADSRPLFAGIDGGGSATRALIASADGAIFGCGFAEGSNPSQFGGTVACERLSAALAAAWRETGLQPQPLCRVFCGVAGLGAYAAQNRVEPLWAEVFPDLPATQIGWDHDLRTALAGGLVGKPGIVLIAGTGSACYARNGSGQTTQVGGWGSLLDDVGSGYAFGLALLKHAVRVWEGRSPTSTLVPRLTAASGLCTPADALRWTKSFADPRAEIAGLSRLVFESWREGNPIATAWVTEGAKDLARLVTLAAERIFPGQTSHGAFSGGLSQDFGYFDQIRRAVPEQSRVIFQPTELNATAGALLLALAEYDVTPSKELMKKLRNLSRPASVLAK